MQAEENKNETALDDSPMDEKEFFRKMVNQRVVFVQKESKVLKRYIECITRKNEAAKKEKFKWSKDDEIEMYNCAAEVAKPILFAIEDIYGIYKKIKKKK